MTTEEVRAALRTLTVSECRVFYWAAKGVPRTQIADNLHVTPRTVYFHLNNSYRKLGLEGMDIHARERLIAREYWPVINALISDPETDCAKRQPADDIVVGPEEEEPIKEVKEDAQCGLILSGGGPLVDPSIRIVRERFIPRWVWFLLILFAVLAAGGIGAAITVWLTRPQPVAVAILTPTVTTVPISTPIPPTSTATSLPPTPTATPVPPTMTATPVPPTMTATPPPATPTSIPSTPTAHAEVRKTAPGCHISAGQGDVLGGVTVEIKQGLNIVTSGDTKLCAPREVLENRSGHQIVVVWQNSFVHVQDDRGKKYLQWRRNDTNFDKIKQFALSDGSTQLIDGYIGGIFSPGPTSDTNFAYFEGGIDPSAKYLVITIDKMVGMRTLTWRFDLP